MNARMRKRWWVVVALLPGVAAAQGFTDVTASAGVGNPGRYNTNAAWGDYDGDGDLDLCVTNWATDLPNRLYRNDGSTTFADVAPALGVDNEVNSVAAAWADYDDDGDLDLCVGDFFEQSSLYQNGGAGQAFTEVGRARQMIDLEKQGNVFAVGWGDYDNDGFLDLYLGKYYYDNDLYHNRGDGTLEQVLDLGVGDRRDTNGFDWVDYDNDGDLDLYVVNREQENALYRNDLSAGGLFVDVACSLAVADAEIGQGGAWADYDNDGDLDCYVANVGANALYRNDGADAFANVAAAAGAALPSSGWITAAAAWADYNGDGFSDLYLANGADRQDQLDVLLAGTAAGAFADSTGLAGLPTTPSYHMAATWADADGNGAPDLYVTDGGGLGNRLFLNGAEASRFLRVVVRGKGPAAGGANRYGLGAQVRLIDAVSGDTVAYQQVLPRTALGRTVDSGGAVAGGSEVTFGAPAGPYNVQVRFPGNPVPMVVGNQSGGDLVVVDEP